MSGDLERAVEAARAHVGDLVTARHQELDEARRLRERSRAAPSLAELGDLATKHEARAAELAGEIESARAEAHAAEVALERSRSAEG